MKVEIRPMRAADISRVCTVIDEAYRTQLQRLYGDGPLGRWFPTQPARIRGYWERQPQGALVADAGGRLVGVNFVRTYGALGWFHTLGVLPDAQGHGIGTRLIQAAVAHMSAQGARVQGLVTWPQSYENIALYSRLGFRPSDLTLLLWRRVQGKPFPGAVLDPVRLLSELDGAERRTALEQIAALCNRLMRGLDYISWLLWSEEHEVGDTLLWIRQRQVAGFAHFYLLWGSTDFEIKLLVTEPGEVALPGFMRLMEAARCEAERAQRVTFSIPVQPLCWPVYSGLLQAGFRLGQIPMLRLIKEDNLDPAQPVRRDVIDAAGAIHCLRLGG